MPLKGVFARIPMEGCSFRQLIFGSVNIHHLFLSVAFQFAIATSPKHILTACHDQAIMPSNELPISRRERAAREDAEITRVLRAKRSTGVQVGGQSSSRSRPMSQLSYRACRHRRLSRRPRHARIAGSCAGTPWLSHCNTGEPSSRELTDIT
jgi:hypothetical protein